MAKPNGAQIELPTETVFLRSDDDRAECFDDEEYPSCTLHDHYFDFALHSLVEGRRDCTLSIESWDHREILLVVRKQ